MPEADPVYEYVDKKIGRLKSDLNKRVDELKNDLLTNKIAELRDKVSSLEKAIIEQRQLIFISKINHLENLLLHWIHAESGGHLPIPPHRLLPSQSPDTCFNKLQIYMTNARRQIEQLNELDQMEPLWNKLREEINTVLSQFAFSPIQWIG